MSAALLCLLAAAPVAGAQGPPAPDSPRQFRAAKVVGDAERPEAFEFELGDYVYRVAGNGAGRRVKGNQTRLFNLRLEGSDWIERVYYAEHEGNVLLVCEVTDGEFGDGFVVRLEQPSMRALWRARLPSFNVGPPLREGGYLYLTAHGFVAKLELATGRFLWRRDNLYKRGGGETFNSFARPEVVGDAVVFRDGPAGGLPPRSVRVHRKTGKILGIE